MQLHVLMQPCASPLTSAAVLAGSSRGQRRSRLQWLSAICLAACLAACSGDSCSCTSVIDDCLDEAKEDGALTDAEVERCGALERVCLSECERAEASEPNPWEEWRTD